MLDVSTRAGGDVEHAMYRFLIREIKNKKNHVNISNKGNKRGKILETLHLRG